MCSEYNDILEDMTEECSRHGKCIVVIIPKPSTNGSPDPPYVGKVVIEFGDANGAMRARNALHGRKFDGRIVEAGFLPEHLYTSGIYTL